METYLLFIGMFLSSLCGVYVATKLSWREGRSTSEGVLDKMLDSEMAKEVRELLKQANEFTKSPEGKETFNNIMTLIQTASDIVKKGVTISPKNTGERLIKPPPKPVKIREQ